MGSSLLGGEDVLGKKTKEMQKRMKPNGLELEFWLETVPKLPEFSLNPSPKQCVNSKEEKN